MLLNPNPEIKINNLNTEFDNFNVDTELLPEVPEASNHPRSIFDPKNLHGIASLLKRTPK